MRSLFGSIEMAQAASKDQSRILRTLLSWRRLFVRGCFISMHRIVVVCTVESVTRWARASHCTMTPPWLQATKDAPGRGFTPARGDRSARSPRIHLAKAKALSFFPREGECVRGAGGGGRTS